MNPRYVTSIELSKQLKEAGIPQESEWYWLQAKNNKEIIKLVSKEWLEKQIKNTEDFETNGPRIILGVSLEDRGFYYGDYYSAFHVGELGEMLPWYITKNDHNHVLSMYKSDSGLSIVTYVGFPEYYENESEAEARGKMLLYLKKEGLI